jgi:putative redox protein
MSNEAMSSEAGAAEVLVVAADLESGPAPYEQRITMGHHTVTCDEPVARGGGDRGADRKGWDLGTVKVGIKLLRVGDKERIDRTIQLQRKLAPEQITRLLEIADKTPVTKLLATGVQIRTGLQ